jgi:pimeloyl-ACP methyl ester carboxylesterase
MLRPARKAGFLEKKLDTGEVILNYLAGPNNGVPLVLIPGQGLSLESYQRVLIPLSKAFQVFVVDVRGHGKSGWTTGRYTFPTIGNDFKVFLKHIVKRSAIICGNSSGGLIALWLAANAAEKIKGIILEDAPLFSAEWPRIRDDCWVYRVFKRNSETIGSPRGRNLAAFFKGMEVPVEGKQQVIKFPEWLTGTIAVMVRIHQGLWPGKPVDLPLLPSETRMMIKSLSEYDPDFTRSFVDGRAYEGFNHTEALLKVRCPLLVLQANWFRHPDYGLVGSMDDRDLEKLRLLVPDFKYKRITSGHMIHFEKPSEYCRIVMDFAALQSERHPDFF